MVFMKIHLLWIALKIKFGLHWCWRHICCWYFFDDNSILSAIRDSFSTWAVLGDGRWPSNLSRNQFVRHARKSSVTVHSVAIFSLVSRSACSWFTCIIRSFFHFDKEISQRFSKLFFLANIFVRFLVHGPIKLMVHKLWTQNKGPLSDIINKSRHAKNIPIKIYAKCCAFAISKSLIFTITKKSSEFPWSVLSERTRTVSSGAAPGLLQDCSVESLPDR